METEEYGNYEHLSKHDNSENLYSPLKYKEIGNEQLTKPQRGSHRQVTVPPRQAPDTTTNSEPIGTMETLGKNTSAQDENEHLYDSLKFNQYRKDENTDDEGTYVQMRLRKMPGTSPSSEQEECEHLYKSLRFTRTENRNDQSVEEDEYVEVRNMPGTAANSEPITKEETSGNGQKTMETETVNKASELRKPLEGEFPWQ